MQLQHTAISQIRLSYVEALLLGQHISNKEKEEESRYAAMLSRMKLCDIRYLDRYTTTYCKYATRAGVMFETSSVVSR